MMENINFVKKIFDQVTDFLCFKVLSRFYVNLIYFIGYMPIAEEKYKNCYGLIMNIIGVFCAAFFILSFIVNTSTTAYQDASKSMWFYTMFATYFCKELTDCMSFQVNNHFDFQFNFYHVLSTFWNRCFTDRICLRFTLNCNALHQI